MNENTRRGLQWQRLAARYFAPRLGGVPEAWAAANAEVAARLFREYEAYFSADAAASRTAYWAGYEEDWLSGMWVRGCFGALYGPDQVDTAKAGPLFYERIFAHAALLLGEVLVVDDSEGALGWAAAVGARTV